MSVCRHRKQGSEGFNISKLILIRHLSKILIRKKKNKLKGNKCVGHCGSLLVRNSMIEVDKWHIFQIHVFIATSVTAYKIKTILSTTVFRVVTPAGLCVNTNVSNELMKPFYPADEGDTFLQHPSTKPRSTFSPPWEPHTSDKYFAFHNTIYFSFIAGKF
jgi:hypothetical protein